MYFKLISLSWVCVSDSKRKKVILWNNCSDFKAPKNIALIERVEKNQTDTQCRKTALERLAYDKNSTIWQPFFLQPVLQKTHNIYLKSETSHMNEKIEV